MTDHHPAAPRIAIVTGGGSGIGRATAMALAGQGVQIAIVDRNVRASQETAALLGGPPHAAFASDISREAEAEAVFDRVEAELGPVAILANFAGVFPWPADGTRPTIVSTSVAEWEQTFTVNALGTFLMLRAMLRRRIATPVEHGRIINISSSAAQLGGYNGSSAYVASKGAVLSLTKVAAREAAPLGITVNAIAPGAIDTPLLRSIMPRERDAAYVERVPMGRIGIAEDVAAAVLYLSSREASYVTGACIDVNGGIRMQ